MIGNVNQMLVEPHQRELQEEAAANRLAATAKPAVAAETPEHESAMRVHSRARLLITAFTGLLGAAVHPANAWHHHNHAGVR